MNRSIIFKMIIVTFAAWSVFIAVDFLLHAVIFAPWWKANGSYWLPPFELFNLIPFAYASFLINCFVLVWLIVRVYGDKPNLLKVISFGAIAGLFYGFSITFANYSLFPMPNSSLFLWPLSFTIELTLVSITARWVLIAKQTLKRAMLCFLIAILIIVIGTVIQNIFPDYFNNVFQKV